MARRLVGRDIPVHSGGRHGKGRDRPTKASHGTHVAAALLSAGAPRP